MAFITLVCSIRLTQILALSSLLLLCASSAMAQGHGKAPQQDAESTLVRVNITTESRGAKDSVEINGKRIADYRPIIIQVFSSTGIVLDEKGRILTFLGYRWVDIHTHDPRIEILTSEGQKYKGKLVGIDQSTGVAVVQLSGATLKKTPICSRCEIKDGTKVMAPIVEDPSLSQFREAQVLSVGSAAGAAEQGGWVMTINRPYPDVGQPILNTDHYVLGFVASQDPMGLRTVVYPISQLLASADKIVRTGGDIRTGWLGVFITDSPPASIPGVGIKRVQEDSPAQKAGLTAEDILLKYNGHEIRDTRQFIQLVQNTPIGSAAGMEILRQGKKITLSARIDARRPHDVQEDLQIQLPGTAALQPSGGTSEVEPQTSRPVLGLETTPLTPQLADFLQIPQQTGLLVLNVKKQMPADLAGVLVGDVIIAVDGQRIVDPLGFASYLQARGPGARLTLKLFRKGVERNIAVQLP